jgi:hypothetical protein
VIAKLFNGIIGAAESRIDREVLRSGNGGWRAGLGVRAARGTEQVGSAVEPNQALRLAKRRCDRCLRGVNRRASVHHAANRTTAIVRGGVTGLIGLVGAGSPVIVTDGGRMQGI